MTMKSASAAPAPSTSSGASSKLRRFATRVARLLPEPPSTNYSFHRRRPDPYRLLSPGSVVYDIGSKSAKGGYWPGSLPPDSKIVAIDIAPGPNVDIVADAQNLSPLPSDSADCVLLVSLLQHIPHPHLVAAEVHRVLRTGGIVYASAPFIWHYHRDPDDFWRFSHRGLEALFERFERVDSGFNRGPASVFADLFARWWALVLCCNSPMAYAGLVYVFKWIFFWIKYLDRIIAHYDMAYVLEGAAYFIGRKHA